MKQDPTCIGVPRARPLRFAADVPEDVRKAISAAWNRAGMGERRGSLRPNATVSSLHSPHEFARQVAAGVAP